jgi:predicted phosphodiesterase
MSRFLKAAAKVDKQREVDDTKDALRRALRALDAEKTRKAELVEAVYAAAKDAASAMSIPKVPKPKADKRTDDPEAAVLLMADWQWGKVTAEYDSDIAKARVEKFTDKALRIIDYVRKHHPVPEVHVLYLGDLVEGELIFPGQAHRIDASLYRQTFEVAEAIANQLRRLKAHADIVKAEGVRGNHGEFGGRSRRDMHPETNADAMAMNTARLIVEGSGIDFPEPRTDNERHWYAIHEVMGKRWFMAHGDQVKGASFGIPWYGFGKKVQGWYMTLGPFDYVATGHWHQTVREDINGIIHFGAGSTESANTYAQEFLAGGGQQGSQWLIFQNADGLTSEHPIRL